MIMDMSVVSVNRIRIPGIVIGWIIAPVPRRIVRSVVISPKTLKLPAW